MPRFFLTKLLATIISLSFIFVQPVAATSLSDDTIIEINNYLEQFAKNTNLPDLAIVIVDQNSTLFAQTYGKINTNTNTPFFLGSLSKSFTAVGIMKLVEQGKVDLNTTLSTYLPDSTDGDQITISQLLNHTSGLGEHQTLANYHITGQQGSYNYANINYALLGKVIEQVSDQSYADFMNATVFAPLGLNHTSASSHNQPIAGYTNYFGLNLEQPHHYPTDDSFWITTPVGYISSTADDLGKYLQMYLNHGDQLLASSSIKQMFYGDTVGVDGGDIEFTYGYGWNILTDYLSEPDIMHDGLVETNSTTMHILPESNLAFAILTNTDDYFVTTPALSDAGFDIARILLGEHPTPISKSEFIFSHLTINLILALIIVISILPLLSLSRFTRRLQAGKNPFIQLLALHLILPAILLSLCPLIFHTPLWVVHDFVPDVFYTIIFSATILFTTGFIKVLLILQRNQSKTPA